MFLEELLGIDRSATKTFIKATLLDKARANGGSLSTSLADRWANQLKQGKYDKKMLIDLARIIGYSDPTGERATRNADRALGLMNY
ncbi:hypothetical protein E4U03_09515 [Rothia nasimurium]|uniref:Uncharacterized protein n=1 Tax=Rothia nasimurium TaxID=85336 RepID=A0A4Y9F1P4_9MICC|nr:hypothetical protein [Rothia nasimurium]MBF0808837.1 hypothetical protein [Rothia nasimurium]TFU21283.1 hypothetical protein E4U03_09515 [Rothia nasimurium]